MSTREKTHADLGYCYGVDDLLDGYCVHTASCPSVGRTWSGPNSDCVHPENRVTVPPGIPAVMTPPVPLRESLRQQVEAIHRVRRLTPPEFRSDRSHGLREWPGPALRFDPAEVTALRGRPRGVDGRGVGEWTTWEHLDEGANPAEMVAWFTTNRPEYEFAVVHARLTVEETTLA